MKIDKSKLQSKDELIHSTNQNVLKVGNTEEMNKQLYDGGERDFHISCSVFLLKFL